MSVSFLQADQKSKSLQFKSSLLHSDPKKKTLQSFKLLNPKKLSGGGIFRQHQQGLQPCLSPVVNPSLALLLVRRDLPHIPLIDLCLLTLLCCRRPKQFSEVRRRCKDRSGACDSGDRGVEGEEHGHELGNPWTLLQLVGVVSSLPNHLKP